MKPLFIKIFRQTAILGVMALTAAILANLFHPRAIPFVQDWSAEARLKTESGESMVIDVTEARKLCMAGGALFLDARSPEEFDAGRVKCAVNLPWLSLEEHIDRVLPMLSGGKTIIAYCDGESCDLSHDLARELIAMGYANVRVLVNGWTVWREHGFPIERR